MDDDIKVLASYVTYRQLYDTTRDIYLIVSKFIEDVILESGFHSFGLQQLSQRIKEQFGFDIPDYVIKTALKKIESVNKDDASYKVDFLTLTKENDSISDSMNDNSYKNEELFNSLLQYIENKRGKFKPLEVNKLKNSFCSYLLNDSISDEFTDLISAFIIENEGNVDFTKQLNKITQGVILFTGLSYSIDISNKSAWNDRIILYVETEILFHLAGYNGLLFKKLADDLFKLIREMNIKSRKNNKYEGNVIQVRYFEAVEDEIDNFFKTAESIVETGYHIRHENCAMIEIINGCKTRSDVVEKRTIFDNILKDQDIQKADDFDYYHDKYHKFNLENQDFIKIYQIDEKPKYIKHLNFVSILRADNLSNTFRKSKHLVLTETGKMLKMSNDFSKHYKKVNLAISMSKLTSILWFDLNKGFGTQEIPESFNILSRAQIVLSKIVTENITNNFKQAQKKFSLGEITKEQMADTIENLRGKMRKPEEINEDCIVDILCSISETEIEINQSEKEFLKNKLNDSREENNSLTNIINNQDREITRIKKENEQSRLNEITYLNEQIVDIEQRKLKADDEIKRKLYLIKWICVIIVPIITVYPIIPVIVSLIVEKKFDHLYVFNKIVNHYSSKYKTKIYKKYFVDENKLRALKDRIMIIEVAQD